MSLINPFKGLRPKPQTAEQVIAPPYDVLNSEEAKLQAKDKPYSFLHISKPEINFEGKTDPYQEAIYQNGSEQLQKFINEGVLEQDKEPYYYIYKIIMGDHTQTGLVAAVSNQAYHDNRVKKHEHTRPDKEADRQRHIATSQAQTGPVMLAYHHQAEIDQIVQNITATAPELDARAEDGIQHQLWVVNDKALITQLTQLFEELGCLYVADGHHRSAAAAKLDKNGKFLAVIFPDDQLRILGYHRVVQDLNGLSVEDFLEKLSPYFTVAQSNDPVDPLHKNEFGMYLDKTWYQLTLIEDSDDLAVSLLTEKIITPILGIKDQRRDPKIDFVGGIRGLKELERRVDNGEMAVAFALYPTSLKELFTVADKNEVMPPKSTWFEPKLADGLVTHLLK